MARRSAAKAQLFPEITVEIRRQSGAPAQPDAAVLTAFFQRAWTQVPEKYHPNLAGFTRVSIDIHYLTDAEIRDLNQQHMNIDTPTDVLSFTMAEIDPERQAFNLGEVVVSFETAAREASERKLPPDEELARYCVHGFLHLLGYEDETPVMRRAMFAVQEKILKAAPRAPKQRAPKSRRPTERKKK